MLLPSMMLRIFSRVALPVLLALGLGDCSDPPQPVETSKAGKDAALPAGHPAMPASVNGEAARASGTISFAGAQFDNPTGTLFVNVRVKGTRPPWLSRKYTLQGSPLATDAAGVKSMPFELRADDQTPMVGTFNTNPGQITAPPGIELELYACYKENGDAGSKTLADAAAVFQSGKSDYELKLTLP